SSRILSVRNFKNHTPLQIFYHKFPSLGYVTFVIKTSDTWHCIMQEKYGMIKITQDGEEWRMIEITNLVKRYKDTVALDHLNLEIREGEIFGLLGPNGSGKTTVINCILALLKYDKGSIRILGNEMRPDSYDIKRQMGVVMQNVAVFDELSVYENIDYFCGLYIN